MSNIVAVVTIINVRKQFATVTTDEMLLVTVVTVASVGKLILTVYSILTVNNRLNALGVYSKIQNFKGAFEGRLFQNAQI